ncbi:condensation domain-containing protein [Micromonospora sp. WMMD882]|uniref:condensation domain-containing protein n=1 Tax=Micromonospora sp. WMMD882 TaxID=3015151 RepID=UPI00248B3F18|nr:condensation domain-containing protein [Micromonospora sp. WMMD882]WBB80561.1 condensation domain-containing protein [Micromonospora sp. WMMD882]
MRIADAVVPAEWADQTLVLAEFGGGRTETAPVTWAQQVMWRAAERSGSNHRFMNLRRTVPVSERVRADLPSVTRALGLLVSRHGALRTRVRSIDGELRQEVAAAGQLPLLVAPGEADGSAAARQAAARLADVAFDHAAEWPLRVALVTVDDRVRQVVLVFSHSAVDAYAVDVVLRDLRLILLRGALRTPPGPQSAQVAREQRGVDQARSARAVERWVREFARLPHPPMDQVGPGLSPRVRRGTLVSSAVDRAARLIAARQRVSVSAVLLAATTALAAGRDSSTVCGLFTMAHNRFRADYADAVANIGQIGMCVVELTDRPAFGELLPRIWRAALTGYRHAYYDPAALRRSFQDAGHDPETAFLPYYYFNDVRLAGGGVETVPVVSEKQLRAATADSSFGWVDGIERAAWHRLTHVVDEPGAAGLTLSVDTRFVAVDTVEPFLRDLEELLVTAAFREVPWPWTPSSTVAGS